MLKFIPDLTGWFGGQERLDLRWAEPGSSSTAPTEPCPETDGHPAHTWVRKVSERCCPGTPSCFDQAHAAIAAMQSLWDRAHGDGDGVYIPEDPPSRLETSADQALYNHLTGQTSQGRGPITYYLATCQDCGPDLPVPFLDEKERAVWVGVHTAHAGHNRITTSTEIRP